jgi:type IX secretion system PorP/SprF family membrane protein
MAYFSYAYHIPLSNGAKLSMGIQGGLDFLRSDWSNLSLPDYAQHDPLFQGIETNVYPNFGTGLFLFHDTYFVGISAPYLLSNTKLNEGNLYEDVRHSRKYFITGGMLIHASPKFVIKPSFLVRMEENMPVAFDLNGNIFYDELVELGISYRYQDSFIGLIGIQMNKYLKFSYSYDWIISDLSPYTKGSHEFALQYRINFYAPRKNKMCPGPLYF